MNAEDLTTINQLIAFLEGTQPVAFEVAGNAPSMVSHGVLPMQTSIFARGHG